jgi:AhpD family alkylhydroperoxidase
MQTTIPQFEEPRMSLKDVSRGAYRAMIALDDAIDFDPTLSELVRLRASILNGCAYCVDMHAKDARTGGETEERLYAVSTWQESPLFDERERAALALADAVTLVADGHVPKDIYDAAADQFPEDELAQLIWRIVAINAWNRVAVTTRMLPGT